MLRALNELSMDDLQTCLHLTVVFIGQPIMRSSDGSWSSDRSMSLLTGVFGVILRRRPVRGVIVGIAHY